MSAAFARLGGRGAGKGGCMAFCGVGGESLGVEVEMLEALRHRWPKGMESRVDIDL